MSEKTKEIKLTYPEISHLLTLLSQREEEGCYSGNKEQYWKRHKRIEEKLTNRSER